MTDVNKRMNPLPFGSNVAVIQICVNPEIQSRIPDHFCLKFWHFLGSLCRWDHSFRRVTFIDCTVTSPDDSNILHFTTVNGCQVTGNNPVTATELFQSTLYGSGTVFHSTSHLLGHFPSFALVWRQTSSNSVTRNYCVLVARPRRCLTLSNPVPWHNWMAAYLGYTLRMRTLFRGWPIMVNDTHTRRRLLSWPAKWHRYLWTH